MIRCSCPLLLFAIFCLPAGAEEPGAETPEVLVQDYAAGIAAGDAAALARLYHAESEEETQAVEAMTALQVAGPRLSLLLAAGEKKFGGEFPSAFGKAESIITMIGRRDDSLAFTPETTVIKTKGDRAFATVTRETPPVPGAPAVRQATSVTMVMHRIEGRWYLADHKQPEARKFLVSIHESAAALAKFAGPATKALDDAKTLEAYQTAIAGDLRTLTAALPEGGLLLGD